MFIKIKWFGGQFGEHLFLCPTIMPKEHMVSYRRCGRSSWFEGLFMNCIWDSLWFIIDVIKECLLQWDWISLLFTWQCFAFEGSRLPSMWAFFLGFSSFGVGFLAFCLKKNLGKNLNHLRWNKHNLIGVQVFFYDGWVLDEWEHAPIRIFPLSLQYYKRSGATKNLKITHVYQEVQAFIKGT